MDDNEAEVKKQVKFGESKSLPTPKRKKKRVGFLNPRAVRAFTFYTIVICIIASVVACVLAIWDFAEQDVFWRLISTFLVLAAGAGAFAFVNGIFGEDDKNIS